MQNGCRPGGEPVDRCFPNSSDLQFRVDLWGRLSNPPDTLERAPEQGFLAEPAAGRKPQKAAILPSKRPGVGGPDHRGQHSNPGSRAVHADVDCVYSPAVNNPERRTTKPVQRRLTQSELSTVAAEYQNGRSLQDLAREFGVHRRTVADHLERLGMDRRVNRPKLTPRDVEQAISQYRAGDSLATVGKALRVDASTVQRALKQSGIGIRPRPGC